MDLEPIAEDTNMGARLKKARKKPSRRLRNQKPGGESRYARKQKLQRKGIFSIYSPFYDPHVHSGYDPRSL